MPGAASLSDLYLELEEWEGDRDVRRESYARGERLRRGEALPRLEPAGEALLAAGGDRLRRGEGDLACLDGRLRLLSRIELCLCECPLESGGGLDDGLLGLTRLDLLSGEMDRLRTWRESD
jgi:hypothetical protein